MALQKNKAINKYLKNFKVKYLHNKLEGKVKTAIKCIDPEFESIY